MPFRKKIPYETKKKIRAYYKFHSIKQAAEKFNVSYSTAWNIINKHLPTPPQTINVNKY